MGRKRAKRPQCRSNDRPQRERFESLDTRAAFGDLAIADVFETVVYWLPADRNTLDTLSHACTATRHHLAHCPNFVDAVFLCRNECHIRCYTPRQQLTVEFATFEGMWRLRDCIRDLQELHLPSSTITNEEFAALLPCCPNVTVLTLYHCKHLTDVCTAAISRCPITSLDMGFLRKVDAFTDNGLKKISRCPLTTLNIGLTELDLSGCKITDSGLKEISRCPLTKLDLFSCSAITAAGLKEISRCPLTNLNLRLCSAITDDGLKEISRCPLTMLDLGATAVTGSGLKEIFQCPLTTLSLHKCDVTDCGDEISRCPLTKLELSLCGGITTDLYKGISRCPLTELDLSFNNITTEGLKEISHCPLTKLDVSHAHIPRDGLKEVSRCPLTTLNVCDCSGVTDDMLRKMLKESKRDLEII